jgi:hypothetical protein
MSLLIVKLILQLGVCHFQRSFAEIIFAGGFAGQWALNKDLTV